MEQIEGFLAGLPLFKSFSLNQIRNLVEQS